MHSRGIASRLAAALAAADGLHADHAAVELISHGAFPCRTDFNRYITAEVSISNGTALALIDWDAARASLGVSVIGLRPLPC